MAQSCLIGGCANHQDGIVIVETQRQIRGIARRKSGTS
jgi:hypothetical protein